MFENSTLGVFEKVGAVQQHEGWKGTQKGLKGSQSGQPWCCCVQLKLTLQTTCQHTRRRTPPIQKGRVVMTVRGTRLDHAHHVLYTRQLQRACREAKVFGVPSLIHLSHVTLHPAIHSPPSSSQACRLLDCQLASSPSTHVHVTAAANPLLPQQTCFASLQPPCTAHSTRHSPASHTPHLHASHSNHLRPHSSGITSLNADAAALI
jgi:hypothetical protein